MRITILTHSTMPFGLMLGRAFADRGHNVTFLSMVEGPDRHCGLPIRTVTSPGFDPSRGSSRVHYARLVLPMRRAVAELSPDILLGIYLSSGGLLACLTGHPRVVVSALGSDVMDRLGSVAWKTLYRWMGLRTARMHAVSLPLAGHLADFGVARDRIVVAPIGIDVDRFPRRTDAGGDAAFAVVCTRRHTPVYDQATLLRAIARLRDREVPARVTFASGSGVQATMDQAAALGVSERTTFLGGYADDELPSILARGDLYVSCSLHDGTSNSLLEALASGLFPVVSDIPANRPWVEDGRTGLLFPPGDDQTLADAIARAGGDVGLRSRALAANRERVEREGSLGVCAGRLLESFEEILA